MMIRKFLSSILLLLALSTLTFGGYSQELSAATESEPRPSQGYIKFDTTFHDFGKIMADGGTVAYNFEFENTGEGDVVILDAKAPCGCTRPSYPTSPIEPGQRNKVKITYDPKGRYGAFNKSVTLYLDNCNKRRIVLKISGTVLKSDCDEN